MALMGIVIEEIGRAVIDGLAHSRAELRRAWRWLTGRCARCGTGTRVVGAPARAYGRLDVHSVTAARYGWCRDCGKRHNWAVNYAGAGDVRTGRLIGYDGRTVFDPRSTNGDKK